MDNMTRRAVAAQIAITGLIVGAFARLKSDDSGQGSVEYVGIILVVVAIIMAVVAAVGLSDIDEVIVEKIKTAIASVG